MTSPRARRIRSVPFVAMLPRAHDVRVGGDFTGWFRAGIPRWDEGDGPWRTMLPLIPGAYECRLLIGGDWANDKKAEQGVKNLLGGEHCILIVI